MEFWDGPGTAWLQQKCGFLRSINVVSSDKKVRPGWTPIFYAASSGSAEVLRFLIEQGADCSHKDRYGQTAIAYSKGNHIRQIIKNEQEKQVLRHEFTTLCEEAQALIAGASAKATHARELDIKSTEANAPPDDAFRAQRQASLRYAGPSRSRREKFTELVLHRTRTSQNSYVTDNRRCPGALTPRARRRPAAARPRRVIQGLGAAAIRALAESHRLLGAAAARHDRLTALKRVFFGGPALSAAAAADAAERFRGASAGAPALDAEGLRRAAAGLAPAECADDELLRAIVSSYDASHSRGALQPAEFIQVGAGFASAAAAARLAPSIACAAGMASESVPHCRAGPSQLPSDSRRTGPGRARRGAGRLPA